MTPPKNLKSTPEPDFAVCLGGRSLHDYQQALELKGIRIGDIAAGSLVDIPLQAQLETVGVTIRSVRNLGFADGARLDEVLDAGLKNGLSLARAEVALAYWLQHSCPDTHDDWLQVAMAPIEDCRGKLAILAVGRDRFGPCLLAFNGEPSGFQAAYLRFLFIAGPDLGYAATCQRPSN